MMHISGTAREKDVTKNAIALTRAPKSNPALPSAPLGLGAAAAPSAARAVVRDLARALTTTVARARALETRVVDAARARGVGVAAPMDKPSRRVVARARRSRATRPRAASARVVVVVVVAAAASAIVAVVASRRVARWSADDAALLDDAARGRARRRSGARGAVVGRGEGVGERARVSHETGGGARRDARRRRDDCAIDSID